MNLRILTSDRQLIKELLMEDIDKFSGRIELSTDCSIKPLQTYEPSYGMIGTPEVLEFIVIVTTNIGSGLLANWIFEMIKKRNIQAEIDGKQFPFSQEEIEQIIQSRMNGKDNV